jgi:hypothetical protein
VSEKQARRLSLAPSLSLACWLIAPVTMTSVGGFDFSLVQRNALLELKGCNGPKPWKTGTTISGIVFKVRTQRPPTSDRSHGDPREMMAYLEASPERSSAGATHQMHSLRSALRHALPVRPVCACPPPTLRITSAGRRGVGC